MVLSYYMISSGEEKAWKILGSLDPFAVCRNGSVSFDRAAGWYSIRSFCTEFSVDPRGKTIRSPDGRGEVFIRRYAYFFIHSCLWYLIHAKDIPLSGKLIKPEGIQGGELFFRGSHVLPLEKLARKYGEDAPSFLRKGRELCSETEPYGDAAFRVFPMPRIPVTLILWLRDEEFPARAGLLFDSTADIHLPLDMLWSLAMLSILVMA
ncbi:MAG: DUF3786 domain-containing protein [Nitrospirota bacterium]